MQGKVTAGRERGGGHGRGKRAATALLALAAFAVCWRAPGGEDPAGDAAWSWWKARSREEAAVAGGEDARDPEPAGATDPAVPGDGDAAVAEPLAATLAAAEAGDADAQLGMGLAFLEGEGVPQSASKAAQWFLRAALQGHVPSRHNLACLYYNGEGVPQSTGEAVKWWKRAAAQGHVGSQYNLGTLYRDGDGVEQDGTEAAKWFRMAAGQFHDGESDG